jgi:hypothetical protein
MMRLVRTRARWLIPALLVGVLVIAGVVVGMGGNSAQNSAAEPPTSSESARAGDSGFAAKPAAQSAPAAAPAGGGAANSSAGGAGSAATGAQQSQPSGHPSTNTTQPNAPRQIIKTGTLSLVLNDVDSGMSQVRAVAKQHDGDVLQENATKSGDHRVADMVIQVPSDRFDDVMVALRGLNGLVDRPVDRTSSQDVTEEYVDLQAQIKNLQATEGKLLELQGKATRMEDILSLQREITNIRGQIDRLQGRANYLDKRSAMSTINLHLQPEGAPARTGQPAWRFGEVLARAWARSLVVFQGMATVLINVAVFALWLLPLALVGWLAWRFLRRERTAPTAPTAAPTSPAAPPATGD